MSCARKPVSASVSAVPQPMIAATLLSGAGPFLVERDRARHLIAVIVGVDVELLAADAAILVDPGEGVRDALPIGRADVRRAAGIIREMADGDLGLRR